MKVVINRFRPLESSLPGLLRDAACRRLLIADKEVSVILYTTPESFKDPP